MTDEMKTCARCKEQFPATPEYFGKPRIIKGKEVLRSYCIECRRKNKRESHWRNRDKNNERAKNWYHDNRDEVRKEFKERYDNDPEFRELYRQRAKKHYAKNAESRKEYIGKWQKNNPDKMRYYRNETYNRNKDAIKARAKIHNQKPHVKERKRQWERDEYRTNPDFRIKMKVKAAKRRNAQGTHTAQDIKDLYSEQNGLCYYCSIELNGDYHVDHKKPISRGGSNDKSNLACACAMCNLQKGAMTEDEFRASKG